MGFFNRLFGGLHHSSALKLGRPATLENAKKMLSDVVNGQSLEDMKLTAQRVKRLNDEMPEFVTFSMSYYCDNTRLVRFTNEGGKQIDAETISHLFAQTGVLQAERDIQRLLGDPDEMRGRLRPDQMRHADPQPLADRTGELMADANGDATDPALRAWLYALLDQSGVIGETTGGAIAPILEALGRADAASVAGAVVPLLYADQPKAPAYLTDLTATTTDYMKAYAIVTA